MGRGDQSDRSTERFSITPFAGLTDGTLSAERLHHYVHQDALYPTDFARALSIAAARSRDETVLVRFAGHAVGAMTVEFSLREGFFAEFGLACDDIAQTPATPPTLAYTGYLLRVASSGTYAELIGALLARNWIYRGVGELLLQGDSPNPLYGRWIDTYGNEEFAAVVEAVLALVDRVGG